MAYKQREYEQSEALKNAESALSGIAAQKPSEYTSQYGTKINGLMDQILNQGDFSYDVNGDVLYNQLKDRTINLGQQAMMDTMGQAAKLTGGYGNSYAQMAGQQAYQGMLQGLTDKVPELYQLALDRYNQKNQDRYNQLGLLNTQEQSDYDRWMDSNNMWLNERDYLTNRYDSERNYDYGTYRDKVGDDQWLASFNEDLRRYNQEWDAAHPKVVAGSDSNPGGPKPGDLNMEDIYQIMYNAEVAASTAKGTSASALNEFKAKLPALSVVQPLLNVKNNEDLLRRK